MLRGTSTENAPLSRNARFLAGVRKTSMFCAYQKSTRASCHNKGRRQSTNTKFQNRCAARRKMLSNLEAHGDIEGAIELKWLTHVTRSETLRRDQQLITVNPMPVDSEHICHSMSDGDG